MSPFTTASRWFALVALCLVALFALTFGAGIWLSILIALFDQKREGSLPLADAVLSAGMFKIVPLASAWLFGGFLGSKICSEPGVSRFEALLRGALIGALSALVMYVLFELDVLSRDYSLAIETSAERGRALNQGVFSVVVPIAPIIGALAARSLRNRQKGR